MKTRLLVLAIVVICMFSLVGCSSDKDPVLPSDIVVPCAQPAVFQIAAFGDVEVTYPQTVTTRKVEEVSTTSGNSGYLSYLGRRSYFGSSLSGSGSVSPWRSHLLGDPSYYRRRTFQDMLGGNTDTTPPAPARSLLENAYQRDRNEGVIENAMTEGDYCWEKVAENPDRYLKASTLTTLTLKGVNYAHGSGFAVSREGILLTNAHVVSDPEGFSSPALLKTPLMQTLEDLTREFGEAPPEPLQSKLVRSLLDWYAGQAEFKGTFTEARVVKAVKEDPLQSLLEGHSLLGSLNTPEDPDQELRNRSVPATILAKGDIWPGKDVAVLKIHAPDALVCLTLGDSDAVRPGTQIHAMGYPGAAVTPDMTQEANYRVITHNGEIDQRMDMVGDWKAFHMTAETNHGDSGGPVIDSRGEVIGINVAGNPNAAAQNYAIPINIAKGYLEQAGIKPDPGPVTQHWFDGQEAFSQQEYTQAQDEFEAMRPNLDNLNSLGTLPDWKTLLYPNAKSDNDYVAEMISQCKEAIKAGKDKTGSIYIARRAVTKSAHEHPLASSLITLFIVYHVLAALGRSARKR